jgi:hypothetical protein
MAAIGFEPGRLEVIQFSTATLEGPGLWRLEGILRGQGGTEAMAAAGMAAGAGFLLLDEALVPLPQTSATVGLPLHLRVGPRGLGHDHPAAVHRVVVPRAEALRPRAPTHGRARREASAVVFRWIRRSRVDDDRWMALDAPRGEEIEAYRVQVFDAGRLVREAIVEVPSFVYTDADYADDGVTGAVTVRVAQLSAAVGAGAELEIGIDG